MASNAAAINLLDLNDDCLLAIFHCFSISEAFDLIGVLDRRCDNVLYRRIARLKHLRFELRDYRDYSTEQLEVIGANLKSLSISAGYSLHDEVALQLLRPVCASGAGAALQQLTLNYVQFGQAHARCIALVAPQLTAVDLSFCELQDALLEPLLQQCLRLRTLKLLGNYVLKGMSLWTIKTKELRALELELHELWLLDVGAFHAQHPTICILAYDKGRSSKNLYGQSTCFN